MIRQNRSRIYSCTLFCLIASISLAGCHHEEDQTSRVKTLKVDEHGHVHDEIDGHDHSHSVEKRISSH